MDVSFANLLASFASAFDQDQHLFTLHFADAALEGLLLSRTLTGAEALSECYRFELTCLSPDASIELKTLMGQVLPSKYLEHTEPVM
ncbi:MAG: putative vgr related protein [Verrucomicrobiaceae bacterium]|nr:putative vgr related protein [Verrucomicrobiaceae bacterium]